MDREDIIKLARQAGLCTWFVPPQEAVERFERFAELVAAAEREACAKVCEEAKALRLAEIIRAMGQA